MSGPLTTVDQQDAVFERNRGLAVGANVDSASFTNCRFIGNNGGIVPYTSDNTTVTGILSYQPTALLTGSMIRN